MSYLTVSPDLMATAAASLEEIRSAIGAASAAATLPTTGLASAAADEVSEAVAALFGTYGAEYQAVVGHVGSLQQQFASKVAAGARAYAQAETAIQSLLSGGGGAGTAAAVNNLILGASGYPIPSQEYIDGIPALFGFPAGLNIGINTPEGLYPLTGVKSLTFDVSAAQGVQILNNAINSAIASPGYISANVFGYSQSAVIASMEMAALNPLNLPYPLGTSIQGLNFTLVGNPANPNGGLLARFPGLSLPSLGLDLFGTATPGNSFPTKIYTIEYDGFGDFPQYPLNVFADVNAFLGIIELHGHYPFLTPQQLTPISMGGTAVELTNTVGPTQSQYFIIPTEHLPLLSPLRAIPVIGSPLAALIEPDMRVIVNLGYGSTTQGWSPDPPNVPTGFGVIPPVPPGEIFAALGAGAQEGVIDFNTSLRTEVAPHFANLPTTVPAQLGSTLGAVATTGSSFVPAVTTAVSSPEGFLATLQSANSYVVNGVTASTSAAYAAALPTVDIVNAALTSLPSYNVNLFLDGVEQIIDGDPVGGAVYAVGAPISANVGMYTLFAGFEVRVLQHAASQIAAAWTAQPPPTQSTGLLGL